MPASNIQRQLAYQICPIILTGGIAAQLPWSMLPMLNLMSPSGSLAPSILPFLDSDLDDAFAAFNVVPGGQLVLQQIGKYPFANQYVAANAVVREPLTLSVLMDTPMRGENPWTLKSQVFTSLKATLDSHNNAGGTYTIATPAYIYENMVMTSLTDISRGGNPVPQNAWRFDFEKPLVALSELQQGAQNLVTSAMSMGLVTNGSSSGVLQGSQTAQPSQMGGSIKTQAALAGGPPGRSTPPPSTQTGFNYPALPPSPGFPYGGIA